MIIKKAEISMATDDRRINRTRQLLARAIVELIIEKGYDAITVQDIIDRANVGRSTFYAHYTDKENLLLGGMNQVFGNFSEEQQAHSGRNAQPTPLTFQQISLALLKHVQSHEALYRALISKGSSETIIKKVLLYFFQYIESLLRNKPLIRETADRLNVPVGLLVHHIAGAFLTLLEWWLNNNLPYTAEELYAVFSRLTLHPLELDSLS